MSGAHQVSSGSLTLIELARILREQQTLELSPETVLKIEAGYQSTNQSPTSPKDSDTGYSSASPESLGSDQTKPAFPSASLLMAQACGTGAEVPTEVVRLMLFLQIRFLAFGHSGVRVSTVRRLLDFYNREVYPVVYEQGAANDRGEATALAHLVLPLLGQGEVRFQTYLLQGADVLNIFSWEPLQLSGHETRALLTGHHFSVAYGLHLLLQTHRLALQADVIGALSLDAFLCRQDSGLAVPQITAALPGNILSGSCIKSLLSGSQLQTSTSFDALNPYAFQSIPQVHGANLDALSYVSQVFASQLQASAEIPVGFLNEGTSEFSGYSAGQPLALALDFLGLALVEWASLAEQRLAQLASGRRGLPLFLNQDTQSHQNSWSPLPAAGVLVRQMRQLNTPTSSSGFASSEGDAGFGSQAGVAALKLYRLVQHLEQVLALEMYTANQALTFREPARTSPVLENLLAAYRQQVLGVQTEEPIFKKVGRSVSFLQNFAFPNPWPETE